MLWLPLAAAMMVGPQQASASASSTAADAAEQQASSPQHLDDPVRVDDVEVRTRRGAALVPPETELDGADIDALAAWDIGEVLRRMNETLGLGEEPMVLINGKRAPNAAVFSGFPPDALARAEVLPPEAGALYGGAPGQRVVNLVLQRRFSSHDGRLSGSRPTQGGASSLSADVRRSAIAGDRTHQLGLRVSRDTALRAEERQRGPFEERADDGAVTLRPRVDVVSGNASMTRPLGDWSGVFSVNGQARDSRSVVRFGGRLLESRGRSESLGASAGFSGRAAGWSVQANLNGQALRAREDGFADARNETRSLGLTSSANRALFELPTGAVVVNLNGHLRRGWSTVGRDGGRASTDFHTGEARGSLAIPLSNGGVGRARRLVGELLATVGGSVRQTGAGSGDELNGGLAWTPRKGLRLNGLWSTSNDNVPDLQRFEPVYHGAPTVVFDFRTGQAVEIVPIRGGNPDLRSPRSERVSLTAAAGPFTPWGLTGNLGYQRMASTDGIGSLPDLTEDVEAALPDRFRRDRDGRLISIDYRPINSRSSLSETLSSSLNFRLPRPDGAAANEGMVLRVALSHSLRLRNTVTLLEGRPDLDRLKGDGGGVSRRESRGTLDARRGRWGVNASARWQDGYRTRRASGLNDPRDLVTAPFTTVDVRLSYQMISSARPSLQDGEEGLSSRRGGGLQLSLEIDNLFDARPEARLGDGSPAPGYGRDLQDPMGRTVRLTLQRRF